MPGGDRADRQQGTRLKLSVFLFCPPCSCPSGSEKVCTVHVSRYTQDRCPHHLAVLSGLGGPDRSRGSLGSAVVVCMSPPGRKIRMGGVMVLGADLGKTGECVGRCLCIVQTSQEVLFLTFLLLLSSMSSSLWLEQSSKHNGFWSKAG